jgi:uncharacterized protein (DUF58 family)
MNPDHRRQLTEGEQLGHRYILAIPQSALSGLTGSLLGRQAGTSIDFQEHRDYQPGDDLQSIDWNIYARSDRLVVKLYREEVNPHLDLVLDGSRSMALAGTAKAEALCRLAGLLAVAAENAGCTHSVWVNGQGFQRIANDRNAPSAWAELSLDGVRSMAEDLHLAPPGLRRLGLRVLISDLFWLGDPLPMLRHLSDQAAAVWVLQLVAQADTAAPGLGSLRLVDSETAEELDLFVDATAQQRYQNALSEHRQAWEQACRQCRARLLPLVAESVLQPEGFRPLEAAGMLQLA